jgi:VanZ family protein
MNNKIEHTLRYLFGIELITITILSLIPATSVPSGIQFWDKGQHGLMFFVLAVTGCVAFQRSWGLICFGLILYGGILELLQDTLTATRCGDVSDWLADGVGILIGAAAYGLAKRFSKTAHQVSS